MEALLWRPVFEDAEVFELIAGLVRGLEVFITGAATAGTGAATAGTGAATAVRMGVAIID